MSLGIYEIDYRHCFGSIRCEKANSIITWFTVVLLWRVKSTSRIGSDISLTCNYKICGIMRLRNDSLYFNIYIYIYMHTYELHTNTYTLLSQFRLRYCDRSVTSSQKETAYFPLAQDPNLGVLRSWYIGDSKSAYKLAELSGIKLKLDNPSLWKSIQQI